MEITFRKSTHSNAQFVYGDDLIIGSVKRVEGWTTRGAPVRWEAYFKGKMIGSAETRKAAAEILASRQRNA